MNLWSLVVRASPAVPLAVIAYQTAQLSHMLPSRAWRLVASGIAVMFIVLVYRITTAIQVLSTYGSAGAFIGWTLMAFGFHDLRVAIKRITQGRAHSRATDEEVPK